MYSARLRLEHSEQARRTTFGSSGVAPKGDPYAEFLLPRGQRIRSHSIHSYCRRNSANPVNADELRDEPG
jgi:hypothetical protein